MSDSINISVNVNRKPKIVGMSSADVDAITRYTSKLDVFLKKITTADQIKGICEAWVECLNEYPNNEKAPSLKGELEKFANGINEQTLFEDVVEDFKDHIHDLKILMLENILSDISADIINQTEGMIEEPETIAKVNDNPTSNAYIDSFMNSYSKYMEMVIENANNVYQPISQRLKSSEEQINNSMQKIKELMQLANLPEELRDGFPIPTAQQVQTPVEKGKYLEQVRQYLDGNLEENDYTKLNLTVNNIHTESQKLSGKYILEMNFAQANEVIQSEAYTWNERKAYLRIMYERLRITNVGQNIKDVGPYLDSSGHASEWLKDVATTVNNLDMNNGTVMDVRNAMYDTFSVKVWAATTDLAKHEGLMQHSMTEITGLKQVVRGADPLLMISSQEYRDYKSEVIATEKLMKQYNRDLQRSGQLTPEQVERMLQSADRVEARAMAYADYKWDALDGKAPNHTEIKRLQAAALGCSYADNIRRAVNAHTLQNAANKSKDQLLTSVTTLMQGESVRNTHHLAQLLYLQNVRNLYQKNVDGFKMQEALSYDSIQANAWKLEKDPAFKKAINHFDMTLPSAEAQSQVYTNYVNFKIAENRQLQENAQHQQVNAQHQQEEPQIQGPGVGQH